VRLRKHAVAGALIALAGLALVGCSSSSGSDSSGAGTTITYWATNQGATLQDDQKILAPQLAKFTQETGIKVNLQVLPWSDDDTKILAAVASGQGPDVLNFGNTDAWTFGSTGALLPWTSANLAKVGGSGKFIPNVLAAAGSAPYTSLPLYSQAYGLFYNKAMFQKAGLTPPTTWQEVLSDAKKFTDPATQTYGMALQGASVSENMHFAYIFARQNGGSPFNSKNQPTFTTAGNVDGLQQYLELMEDGVVNPSEAQDSTGTLQMSDFVHGKAAMMMYQNSAISSLAGLGMSTSQFGVVPIPAPSPLPQGGDDLASFVAGTNIAIFKNTQHLTAALKFVNFMTSKSEQEILDKEYQLLPVLKGAQLNFLNSPTMAQTFTNILDNEAAPLPVEANTEAYQQTVGAQMVTLFGKAATGTKLSASDIEAALQAAQDQMPPAQ
jgi:multiple sugar transport system substrate-binding protein